MHPLDRAVLIVTAVAIPLLMVCLYFARARIMRRLRAIGHRIGFAYFICWHLRKPILLNLTGLGGLGMMFAGLWLYDPALSLTVIGAILFSVAIYCIRFRPPDSW